MTISLSQEQTETKTVRLIGNMPLRSAYLFLLIVICFVAFFTYRTIETSRGSWDIQFPPQEQENTSTWRFINLPDLHNTDRYLKQAGRLSTPDERASLRSSQSAMYKSIFDQIGGELAVLPGDTGTAEWYTEELVQQFGMDLAPDEQIRKTAELVYPQMRGAFADAGYDTLLLAVGDHEIANDPWYPGSLKDQMIPVLKEAVEKHFTDHLRQKFKSKGLFTTPVGTPFEGTSYALRYRNVVFVSVDQFLHRHSTIQVYTKRLTETLKLASMVDPVHDTIVGTVTGDHLKWFEAVLEAASQTNGVDHIIVFGHLPILGPVRGRRSSMLYFEGGVESAFWKLMRRYGVALYLAGEVHANTVLEDKDRGPVQISVASGSPGSLVSSFDVSPDRILMRMFEAREEKIVENGSYEIDFNKHHTSSTGELVPVNLTEPLLSYNFELVSGKIPNFGTFGKAYDLVCENCDTAQDAITSSALQVSGQGATFADDHESPIFHNGACCATLSFWIRQAKDSHSRISILSTDVFTKREGFEFYVENGNLGMRVANRSHIIFKSSTNLSNGSWHRVIIRHDGGKARGIEVKIDDEDTAPSYAGLVDRVFGGTPRSANYRPFRIGGSRPYKHTSAIEIDGLQYWARKLKDHELETELLRR